MWGFFKPESAPLFYACFQTTHQQVRFFMLKNMIFIMIKSQRYPWSVSGWVSNVTQRVFRVLAQFQIVKREHMKERLNKMVSSFEQITQDFSRPPPPPISGTGACAVNLSNAQQLKSPCIHEAPGRCTLALHCEILKWFLSLTFFCSGIWSASELRPYSLVFRTCSEETLLKIRIILA